MKPDKLILERHVEKRLTDGVKALGGEIRKVAWIGRRGAPDRLVLLPGRTTWVELKRPKGGVLEEHQTREHQRMRLLGCDVRVIWSSEEVDTFLMEAAAWLQ